MAAILSRPQCVNYLLFVSTDTGIYTHTKHGNATRGRSPSVVLRCSRWINSPYPRKQTKYNEFILCSSDVCHILNMFTALKSQLSFLPGVNKCITTVLLGRIAAARKVDGGRDRHRDVINDALFSLSLYIYLYIYHADGIKREIGVYTSCLLANQMRESAMKMGYIYIYIYIFHRLSAMGMDRSQQPNITYYWNSLNQWIKKAIFDVFNKRLASLRRYSSNNYTML